MRYASNAIGLHRGLTNLGMKSRLNGRSDESDEI